MELLYKIGNLQSSGNSGCKILDAGWNVQGHCRIDYDTWLWKWLQVRNLCRGNQGPRSGHSGSSQ